MNWPDLAFPPINLYSLPTVAMFLEERLPLSLKSGASYADAYGAEFAVDPRTGNSYARLRVAKPAREINGAFINATPDLWENVLALYHRAYGTYAGFRVRFFDDFSSNGQTGAPTAIDQPLEYIAAGVYQLRKQYGTGGTPLSIGLPARTIKKPVSGTVKIAVDGIEQMTGWSVDTTTGRVTFDTPPGGAAVVTGGFEFDVPCRFAERMDINHVAYAYRETGTIKLIEMLNP